MPFSWPHFFIHRTMYSTCIFRWILVPVRCLDEVCLDTSYMVTREDSTRLLRWAKMNTRHRGEGGFGDYLVVRTSTISSIVPKLWFLHVLFPHLWIGGVSHHRQHIPKVILLSLAGDHLQAPSPAVRCQAQENDEATAVGM